MFCSLISPFVLTRELLPILRKTASHPESDVRIVVVREALKQSDITYEISCIGVIGRSQTR